eukprot:5923536-Prymnesium_polylepis.1
MRLHRFFQSLYKCLRRGARAALQFYPQDAEQLQLITASAMRAGFGGGLVVDFPHSTKVRSAARHGSRRTNPNWPCFPRNRPRRGIHVHVRVRIHVHGIRQPPAAQCSRRQAPCATRMHHMHAFLWIASELANPASKAPWAVPGDHAMLHHAKKHFLVLLAGLPDEGFSMPQALGAAARESEPRRAPCKSCQLGLAQSPRSLPRSPKRALCLGCTCAMSAAQIPAGCAREASEERVQQVQALNTERKQHAKRMLRPGKKKSNVCCRA